MLPGQAEERAADPAPLVGGEHQQLCEGPEIAAVREDAQAADELLSIDGVDGSFVLYENEGVIYISARSMGAINVQMIMETLGGGGHHTMAATQIRGMEMEKAKQMLLEAIDKYYESHPLN